MTTDVSNRAGMLVENSQVLNVPRLITSYYKTVADTSIPEQRILFGTYLDLTTELGEPAYWRMDASASPAHKVALANLSATDVPGGMLAGELIIEKLTYAPGNGAPLGGLEVTTANGWFTARPFGTEDVCKIYAESFESTNHLSQSVEEAQALLASVFAAQGLSQ